MDQCFAPWNPSGDRCGGDRLGQATPLGVGGRRLNAGKTPLQAVCALDQLHPHAAHDKRRGEHPPDAGKRRGRIRCQRGQILARGIEGGPQRLVILLHAPATVGKCGQQLDGLEGLLLRARDGKTLENRIVQPMHRIQQGSPGERLDEGITAVFSLPPRTGDEPHLANVPGGQPGQFIMHHIAEKDRVRRLVGDRVDLFEPRLALRRQAAGTLERSCVSDEQKVECKPGFFVEFHSRREGLDDSIGPHVTRIGGVPRYADQSQQLAGEMWRGLPYGGIEPP